MSVRLQSYGFEELVRVVKEALEKSILLYYVDIVEIYPSVVDKDTIPQFKAYCIKLSPPDSGFVTKLPKLGKYYRNQYSIAVELWMKSQRSLADRVLSGNVVADKGIFEFFQDVSDTLEHNTFDGELDPYPGTSISEPVGLATDDQLVEGIGFLWFGNQDNIK